ncbi:hypothetical protein BDZ89DRAFT_1131440 [Hymenopellis radicata]|nr:hypothetical protein BDZ89DRAFT_1131440 [Hymenopellis radicata]
MTESGRCYFIDHNTHTTTWNNPTSQANSTANAKLKLGPLSTTKEIPPAFQDACASDTTTVGFDSDEAQPINRGYPSRSTLEACRPAVTADAEGHDDSEQKAALELQLKQCQDENQKDMIKGLTNKREKLKKENKELRATVLGLQNAEEQAAQKQQGVNAADLLIWTIRSQKLRRALSCTETDTQSPVLTVAKEMLGHLEELSEQLQEQVSGSSSGFLVGSRKEVSAKFGTVLSKRVSESEEAGSHKKARLYEL